MLLKIVKYMFLKIFELNHIRRLPLFSTHMPEQKILIMRKQKYSSFYTSSGAKYHISKSSTLIIQINSTCTSNENTEQNGKSKTTPSQYNIC